MFVGGEGLIYADPPARLKTQLNCERWANLQLARYGFIPAKVKSE